MRDRFRPRLTYANVMATLALFLALGLGTAWAAKELSKNEVKSKNIAPGQVKRSDLAKDAVTSPKILDGSLLGKDFAPGQLPAGLQGPQGLQGPPGATNVTFKTGPYRTVNPDAISEATAFCNPSERATGGGSYSGNGNTEDFQFLASFPRPDYSKAPELWSIPNSWVVEVHNRDVGNNNAETITVAAYVICASP